MAPVKRHYLTWWKPCGLREKREKPNDAIVHTGTNALTDTLIYDSLATAEWRVQPCDSIGSRN